MLFSCLFQNFRFFSPFEIFLQLQIFTYINYIEINAIIIKNEKGKKEENFQWNKIYSFYL